MSPWARMVEPDSVTSTMASTRPSAALASVAEEHPRVLKNPKYDVLFASFGDSSWNMSLRVWIKDPQQHRIIRSEINKAIVKKFREMSIEIPFPQRDLHIKSQPQ